MSGQQQLAAERRKVILSELALRGECSSRFLRWKVNSITRQGAHAHQVGDDLKALKKQGLVSLRKATDISMSGSVLQAPTRAQRIVFARLVR